MSCCFRQTLNLPRKILISQKPAFLKYFSAFSPIYDIQRNNSDTNKLTRQKQILRLRYFSFQNVNSFYDSISSSEASKLTRSILLNTHDLGLSWSDTIIVASVVLKLFIGFPCLIYQHYLISKLELTKAELDGIARSLRDKLLSEAYRRKWNEAKLKLEFHKKLREQWQDLVVKNNCHPFKITILFFIQFPFWLLTTVTLRKFVGDVLSGQCESPVSALQFQVGGPFWSNNLALPDPTYILPTINFLCLLANFELSVASKTHEKIAENFMGFVVHKVVPIFLRLFAVAFFFISASSPSALSLFWAGNTIIALAQNLIIRSPKVRRFLRIPKTASEVDKPYREIWNSFSEKYSKFIIKRK